MSYSVPKERAMTISVDTVSRVSGFLRAKDRVDIILVGYQGEEMKRGNFDILLQDTEILL